jgi:hypothetical protein
MKGYLRRLVKSVAQSEPRVRPLTGSIFGVEPREENVEAGQPVVATSRGDAKAAVDRDKIVQKGFERAVNAQPGARDAAEVSRARERKETVRAEREASAEFVPLLPRRNESGEIPALSARGDSRQKLSPRARKEDLAEAQSAEREKRVEEKVIGEPAVPGVRPMAAGPRLPFSETHPGTLNSESDGKANSKDEVAAPTSIRTVRPEPVAGRAAAKEVGVSNVEAPIEIHIGRIEVIAASAPASRVAPTAPRSTSLEQYLQQRNGRTR